MKYDQTKFNCLLYSKLKSHSFTAVFYFEYQKPGFTWALLKSFFFYPAFNFQRYAKLIELEIQQHLFDHAEMQSVEFSKHNTESYKSNKR